ncbi:hypothetical protein KSF_015960 [Reticulibacter mediterranei]|uniref:Cyanobacterial TRADD-N associated 2 transmembrane domain-containing protein n=1 Tax=Reticulibacter mediterranei TaxID=2778369 RepID=A0A8J3IDK8_9CHLR|nr:hypothetical protein [Reticulibacter mediterranei]GHO91548.1 hypothetical protein KSF_015960 [Reticulibacter mediterranei]
MSLMAALWILAAFIVVIAVVALGVWMVRSNLQATIKACTKARDDFNEADIKDIKKTLLIEMELTGDYYKCVLRQANLSFIFALVFAGIGILIFFSIIIFMVVGFSADLATTVISGVGGALVQVLSAINFYLYRRASDQLQTFHKSLDRLQNYMLANSICQGLEDVPRSLTCAQLSLIIASSSVSENEERVIGEIIKHRAILSTEQTHLYAHNGHNSLTGNATVAP